MSKFRRILYGIVRYVVATASLSVAFYIVFALVFSTAEERQLMRENRLYRDRYTRMKEQEKLIGDVVDGLSQGTHQLQEGRILLLDQQQHGQRP